MRKLIKQHPKLFTFILVDLLIIGALLSYFTIKKSQHVKINGILIESEPVPSFQLTNQYDQQFSQNDLKGKWSFIFFGFTHCPMICPVILSVLNQTYLTLKKDLKPSDLPQVIFISVDPGRDTSARIKKFVNSFNSHFIGLRGDLEKTLQLEKNFHLIQSEREKKKSDGTYNVNHSTDILLINPKGQIQAYFLYPHQPDLLAQDYKLLIKRG